MHKLKTLNNPFNPSQPLPALLSEGLQYKDLDGMMKSTIHVDEFAAKMGDDDDIIVISFFVRDLAAAKDLVGWFEKGSDFVLDADRSPGEIKPSRYLVYLEIRRRRSAPRNIQQLLDDLSTLTEFEPNQWRMRYKGQDHDWSEESFAKMVPLTPDAYRAENETELNDVRTAAGIEPKKIHDKKGDDVKALQSMAGIR
jgi:hypothetical protein